ncbi:MAG: hypothetical protein ACLTXL_14910 [Clostridia bacterium]
MKNICLLDLNYTLVGNQADTRMLRPFSRRMEAEEYRADLIGAIRDAGIFNSQDIVYEMKRRLSCRYCAKYC